MDSLNKLSDDWFSIDSLVLYGTGNHANIVSHAIKKIDNLKILYVLDSDKNKHGHLWNGVPIADYKSVKDKIIGQKILIMTAHTAYNQISQYLRSQGLKENIDFCSSGQFICEWFWKAKKMNCLYHVDMTVTTNCNFKCKHCNMFIPYYKRKKEITYSDLKTNVDLLFSRIDYIAYFALIGGETLLCPHILHILKYMKIKYRNKYGHITLTTNGSIIPDNKLLKYLSENKISFEVSDYTNTVSYKECFDTVIELFNKYNVSYNIRNSLEWVDFGFPLNPVKRTSEELENHLKCCHPEWNGINDGKFYYCNVSWSAEKSGNFKLQPSDYIVLEDINPNDKGQCHKIVELSRGTSSFCKICGGCGSDNKNIIPVGEQI